MTDITSGEQGCGAPVAELSNFLGAIVKIVGTIKCIIPDSDQSSHAPNANPSMQAQNFWHASWAVRFLCFTFIICFYAVVNSKRPSTFILGAGSTLYLTGPYPRMVNSNDQAVFQRKCSSPWIILETKYSITFCVEVF